MCGRYRLRTAQVSKGALAFHVGAAASIHRRIEAHRAVGHVSLDVASGDTQNRPIHRWVGAVTEILTGGGKLYLAVDPRPLLADGGGLGALGGERPAPGAARSRAGAAVALPRGRAAASHRSGQPVRERGLPARA